MLFDTVKKKRYYIRHISKQCWCITLLNMHLENGDDNPALFSGGFVKRSDTITDNGTDTNTAMVIERIRYIRVMQHLMNLSILDQWCIVTSLCMERALAPRVTECVNTWNLDAYPKYRSMLRRIDQERRLCKMLQWTGSWVHGGNYIRCILERGARVPAVLGVSCKEDGWCIRYLHCARGRFVDK